MSKYACFSSKIDPLFSYDLIGSLEIAPGLVSARSLGRAANTPPPGTDKAGKCFAVARGGGGWAQLELTDVLLPGAVVYTLTTEVFIRFCESNKRV